MCYELFRKENTPFTPKNTLLERFLATSLAYYEDDSLDDDSIVSQLRFDAYAYRLWVYWRKNGKLLPFFNKSDHSS